MFRTAVKALQAGNNQDAYTAAEQLVQMAPRDVRGWLLLGTALSGLKKNNESLTAFKHALVLQPRSLAALEGAAQAAYAVRSSETRSLLERLIEVNSRNETAHAMLGALAFQSRKCDEAVRNYEQATKAISTQVNALREYGICLVDLHRSDAAIPVFDRILQLQPEVWQNRHNLALVQYQTRRYADTIATLKGMSDHGAPEREYLNLLAAAYEANHNTDKALATLYRAIAIAPDDIRNYLDLATLCMDHSATQSGIDIINAALKNFPENAELYLERGVLYVQLGKFAEAQADFDQIDRLGARQTLTTLARSIALLQNNNPDESLKVIRARLKTSPNDPELNYALAEVLTRNDGAPGSSSFKEAVAAAEWSVKQKPDFLLAHDLLSGLLLKSGDAMGSILESQRALALDPTDRTAVYHLLSAWRQRGNSAEVTALTTRLRTLIEQARAEQVELNKFRIVEGSQ